MAWYASGRRGVSSIEFRGLQLAAGFTGFTDRPAYANAREIANELIAHYVDGEVDRVEMLYNGYVSPMTQEVRHETLLPLQQADVLGDEEDEEDDSGNGDGPDHSRSLWIYEPDPEEILARLAPDYVEISIYRALLESTASEHGARMTAMRNASENAGELIDDLTLEANRQRQADITQEIMEVVAGAEGSASTHAPEGDTLEQATSEQTEEKQQTGDENGSNDQRPTGRVEEIQGVVIEAAFEGGDLPEIYNALEIDLEQYGEEEGVSSGTGSGGKLICEVQQHLGDDRVRAVAMDTTDGLERGAEVRDTGGPITVPVGKETLGRIFNLLGETIDQGDQVETEERWPIHRPAPEVEDLTPTREIFETGIKVIDLLAPTPRAARSACSAAPAWARPC